MPFGLDGLSRISHRCYKQHTATAASRTQNTMLLALINNKNGMRLASEKGISSGNGGGLRKGVREHFIPIAMLLFSTLSYSALCVGKWALANE